MSAVVETRPPRDNMRLVNEGQMSLHGPSGSALVGRRTTTGVCDDSDPAQQGLSFGYDRVKALLLAYYHWITCKIRGISPSGHFCARTTAHSIFAFPPLFLLTVLLGASMGPLHIFSVFVLIAF